MKNIRIAKIVSKVAARLSAVALLAVLAGTLHAADWVYDNGTVSDGVWTFNAGLGGKSVTVSNVKSGPQVLMPLDFSKPVTDVDGKELFFGYYYRPFKDSSGYASKVSELTLPNSCTGIGDSSFRGCINAAGTIRFPATLQSLDGGAFINCAGIERLIFDPSSSVAIKNGQQFNDCTSLTEVDLSPIVRIQQDGDDRGHFKGCASLKMVTFGSKLDYLDGRTFNGATALETVMFKGPPPATITNTYLYGLNRKVSTVVYLDRDATDYDYATAKAAWDALTADGEINYESSTWKSEYIANVNPILRPLVLYSVPRVSIVATKDANEGQGIIGSFTVSRAEDDITVGALAVQYTVGGTAESGQAYGALSGRMIIPAGSRTGTINVVPLDDPDTVENKTVVVTISAGDYEIVTGSESATLNVINGESFTGWKYSITGDNSGTMSKGDWSFAATHAGRNITVGAVMAYPADISPLDFSAAVAGSDGHAYTIAQLGSSNNGLGLAGDDPGGVPTPSEPGSRVGLLTMPGEGLVSICASAFAFCTNACGVVVFPPSLNTIGDSAFRYTQVSGDLAFPALQRLTAATFQKTKITSVAFSSALQGIWGGWERGPFWGCSSLTNIVFDPASKITLGSQGFIFRHCTALRDLDLSCVTNIAYENCGSNFDGCSSLTNITFGAGLTKLPANTFASASALQSIHFKGAAPVIVGGSVENGGLFTGVGGSQTIKTYVSVKYADVKNSEGLSWNDYVEGDMLGKSSTHWKSDYLYSGADATHFPLLRIDGSSLIIYVR